MGSLCDFRLNFSFQANHLLSRKHSTRNCSPNLSFQRKSICLRRRDDFREFFARENSISLVVACASSQHAEVVVGPIEGVSVISNTTTEDVSVTSTSTEDGKIKIRLDISEAKSEAIFDNVFSKMVAAAQPIPGFRRVKGGKTPNIPRDVLIQILGPSKVYKEVIKKIINSTVAEYVEKENLKVTKNLKVEQSHDELEATFEPGMKFSFDAVLELQEADARIHTL